MKYIYPRAKRSLTFLKKKKREEFSLEKILLKKIDRDERKKEQNERDEQE
jgi:hypothetical protein